jgi:serine/threonine protein kinase
MIGCISDPKNPILVSELCEIGDLKQVLVAHKPHDIFEDRNQCEQKDILCLRGKDLTSFAWQVSDALCYLSSHQIVHRDIAARNIFITRSMTVKLGDFGLCHSLDPQNPLHQTPHGKVPLKWTSIEAIRDGIFSEASDVWSYGVLLFEMYTGASMPYPTIEADQLLNALENGERPEIPPEAPENMQLLMKSCWAEQPEERPAFQDIRCCLTGLLDVSSQAYGYIQFTQTTEAPSSITSFSVSEKEVEI